MNCKFADKCTYFKDANEIGGTLKENTEKFCNNDGTGCSFFLLLDSLGSDYMLPLNITQSDIASAEKIVQNEIPCWTFKKCPEDTKVTCPAFTNKKGKVCWLERGTLCGGKRQGCFIDKLSEVCEECDFYQHRKGTGK
ncbi:MAG: hypothetical protein GY795_42080 [Desulfobacterales bacterium]|nr:hypothetical protein [Desulfobacterales bacterium]